MKYLFAIAAAVLVCSSCANDTTPQGLYGTAFTASNPKILDELVNDTMLKDGDPVQLKGNVCDASPHGTWISFKTSDNRDVMVMSKDKFKLSKFSPGFDAVVNGTWVTVKTHQEEERKAGTPEEEIKEINTPVIIAQGVEIK